MLLQGAINAMGKVGLKFNIMRNDLKELVPKLPALRNPTVSPLSAEEWVAVEIIIEEKQVRRLIPELKRAGAEGIFEYEINKLIY
jgi:ATP phosphoribosyltransferase